MTTEPTVITPSTWFEEMVERTRLPQLQLAARLVLVAVLLLVGAAYLDGILALTLSGGFWRVALASPLMMGYVAPFQPVLKRWRVAAIQSFRRLVPVDDEGFRRSLARASVFNRRREKLAAAVGAAAGLLIQRPWDRTGSAWSWSPVGQSTWLTLVGLLQSLVVFGFIGYFLYSLLSGTRLFGELHSGDLTINAFDLESLQPIAAWSLGIALYFIGGIALSLLTLPWLTLRIEFIIAYVPVTLAPVIVFFLNMRTVHTAMVQAKERELQMVRANLVAASEALRERPAEGKLEEKKELLAHVADWEAHRKLVKALPEWPYTGEIRRNLVLSSLLPWAIGIARTFLPDLMQRFVPADIVPLIERLLPLAGS
jgi:hypothetical protein